MMTCRQAKNGRVLSQGSATWLSQGVTLCTVGKDVDIGGLYRGRGYLFFEFKPIGEGAGGSWSGKGWRNCGYSKPI